MFLKSHYANFTPEKPPKSSQHLSYAFIATSWGQTGNASERGKSVDVAMSVTKMEAPEVPMKGLLVW